MTAVPHVADPAEKLPLAEPDRVDDLRADVGLGTLEEYYAEFPPGGCS